jgi:hypothetical protein
MKRILLVCIIFLSVGDVSSVAQRASPYQIFGDQRTTLCLGWAPAPEYGPGYSSEEWWKRAPAHAWVYGYLAGAGYMPSPVSNERLTPIDVRLVDAWMDRYCAAHPSGTIEGALTALLKELDARR